MRNTMDERGIRDRTAGALFGLAVGDRIGGPTAMAIALGKSLIRNRGYVTTDVLASYLDWWKKGGFDTGTTAARVFSAICSGREPQEAAVYAHRKAKNRSGGCNPMHRSIPIAAAKFIRSEDVDRLSRLEASITHYDEVVGDMTSISTRICRYLILGHGIEEAIEEVIGVDRERFLLPRAELRSDGFAPNVLSAALFFIRHSTSFEDAVSQATRFSGPSNYAAVLVGSWAGAIYGISKIPKQQYSGKVMLIELSSLTIRMLACRVEHVPY